MGPVLHYWYGWLDKFYVGNALRTVGKKVLVDQMVASPTLGLWYFIGERGPRGRFNFHCKRWGVFYDGITGTSGDTDPRGVTNNILNY